MITQFQRIIHRHGRIFFLLLFGVILVAFVLWDPSNLAMQMAHRAEQPVVLFGKEISPGDYNLAKRLVSFEHMLNTGENLSRSEKGQEFMAQLALRQMALVEKARRTGLTVSDGELMPVLGQKVTRLKQMFFRDAPADQAVEMLFAQDVFRLQQINAEAFEQSVRDAILIQKLETLIATTAKVTPQEIAATVADFTDKLTAFVCPFNAGDYTGGIKLGDKDLRDFHQENISQFSIPEKMRVAFVTFPLDVAKAGVTAQEIQDVYEGNQAMFMAADGKVKPLKEVEPRLRTELGRQKAVQEAMKQAADFTLRTGSDGEEPPPSFDALAKEHGLQTRETGFFAMDERVPGITAGGFAATAFRLGSENPVSDPVVGQDAVYVMRFLEKKPSCPTPFENTKDAVRKAYLSEQSLKIAREKGGQQRNDLVALLKSGKSFQEAVLKLKLKPVKPLPPFSQVSEMQDRMASRSGAPSRDSLEILAREVCLRMAAGSVSEWIPDSNGGCFVYLASRQRESAEEIGKIEPRIRQMLLQGRRGQVVEQFEEAVFEEAGIRAERPDLSRQAP